MTDAAQASWTIRSLTDLVEVIPTLLGFHPTDSLVMVALEGGTVALTARADLPPQPHLSLADAVGAVWRRFPTADLLLVAYTTDAGRAWATLNDVDDAMPAETGRVLVHADGRHWFDDPDAAGVPYDGAGSVHLARAAFEGRAVRASRDELRHLVEPAYEPAEVTAAIQRAAERWAVLEDLVGAGLALVEAHDATGGELDLDDATLLCLASHDEAFLDAALLSTTRENAQARADLWLHVVRGSVPSCAGHALVALGLAAWVAGNGALQVVCLEALKGRPAPATWVEFLSALNAEALEPARWPVLQQALLAGAEASDAMGRG